MKLQHALFAMLFGIGTAAHAAIGDAVVGLSYAQGFDPNGIEVGDTFPIYVKGTGFSDKVVGGGFALVYDPAVDLTSVAIANPPWGLGGGEDAATGDVYFNAFALPPGYVGLPRGDFDIATLTFTAKGAGTFTIQSAASALFPWATTDGLAYPLPITYGSIDGTVVPLPAALPLFGGALLGLFGLAGRRQRNRS